MSAYSTRSSDSTTHTTTTHARTDARAENDASVSQSGVFAIVLPIALCAVIISTILGLIQCARRGNRPICCRSAARQQRRQQLQLQLQRLQELQLRQQQRQQLLEQQQQRQRRQQQQQQDETPSGLTTSVMDILDLYYVNPRLLQQDDTPSDERRTDWNVYYDARELTISVIYRPPVYDEIPVLTDQGPVAPPPYSPVADYKDSPPPYSIA